MSNTSSAPAPQVAVSLHGELSPELADYTRTKIGAVLRLAHQPVLSARVRLSRSADPAVPRPVMAQANLDVNGRMVRAVVAAAAEREAVDLLKTKLRHQFERIAGHGQPRRGGAARARDGWRHGDEATHRPAHYPRPTEERQVVRHKSFTSPSATIEEAGFDLEAMDYDFLLFTEQDSGYDSVIYRAGATGYRVAQTQPMPPGLLSGGTLPVTFSPTPAPLLDLGEAIARLNATELPFLFYLDADHIRGCLLYRRYDGHYGLISPAR